MRVLILGMAAVITRLPKTWVPLIGRGVGRMIGCVAWSINRKIQGRLSRLDDPPKIGAVWSDLGERSLEFIDAQRQMERVVVPPETLTVFEETARMGRGILVATLHLGHWELMAARISTLGHPFHAVASRSKAGALYDSLHAHRRSIGVKTLSPGSGARQAVRLLKEGKTVSLFIDQSTGERGRMIPFLGDDAPTPETFERLLEITQAEPLLLWNIRRDDGLYVVYAERPNDAPYLDWLTRRCSELVDEHPTQWVWLHERWTSRQKKKTQDAPQSTLDVPLGSS